MRNDIAQALMLNVLNGSSFEVVDDARKYFQNMAKYKYDDYQQYSPGMRFIERFALWLNQFNDADKSVALKFIREKLIFISHAEMNLLVSSAFPDVIREYFLRDVSDLINVPEYDVAKIIGSKEYKRLVRQSLFCGMSDGAKMEYFRRSNTGVISHEQIYQTYELSDDRAGKMKEELIKDLEKILGTKEIEEAEQKFKNVFLLDDFSASGTSYLKFVTKDGESIGKGKIAAFYRSISQNPGLKEVFDLDHLKVYVIIYLCTEQAKNQIENNFNELEKQYGRKPELICLHIIPNADKLNPVTDEEIVNLCNKDNYYDAEALEDGHTRQGGGSGVKMGFGQCALPVVLFHNTPNNSVPLLWSYDASIKFTGLFPRIPRHKEI
ncbi:phosphoribosyltransferase-like protein [Agriterribacter sp.]|uniref:phosphoribosyltransferase-like protein n=1 Tax=Agriterribacter sp. TaxID=2821509 RepID=UPI002C6A4F1F|nr:hypothetical protein [Agriterribacter sp.]HTN07596.1 hypothetical protein [Agriterribacter sp.]